MDRSSALGLGALALALLLIGGVAWLAGLVAVSQYAEDLCFDDLDARTGYGAYRSEASLWPPAFECRLHGSGAEAVIVQHPVVALLRLGATVVLPVLYGLVATLALTWVARRRRRIPPVRHGPP